MLKLSSNGNDVFLKVLKLSFEVSECEPLPLCRVRRLPRRRRAPRQHHLRLGRQRVQRTLHIGPGRFLLDVIFTFIEPQCAAHGELNQPSPQTLLATS